MCKMKLMSEDIQDTVGTLYIVSTPIGNLEDISFRAVRILLTTELVACEDTRRTGNLLKLLADRYSYIASRTKQRLVSVRDWNEAQMVEKVVQELELGDVALVSDAGTPLISDPGFKLVRAARERGIKVVPVPGASAVLAAIVASGLPTNKFLFWGFLPKKFVFESGLTHIFFESPARLTKTLAIINERYPKAQVVVARELTKVYESISPLKEDRNKGESTVVVYVPADD
jgi:16S rRNA (cytidine1402-2'-O)-methyltransferase